jgi:hypothetical protein
MTEQDYFGDMEERSGPLTGMQLLLAVLLQSSSFYRRDSGRIDCPVFPGVLHF